MGSLWLSTISQENVSPFRHALGNENENVLKTRSRMQNDHVPHVLLLNQFNKLRISSAVSKSMLKHSSRWTFRSAFWFMCSLFETRSQWWILCINTLLLGRYETHILQIISPSKLLFSFGLHFVFTISSFSCYLHFYKTFFLRKKKHWIWSWSICNSSTVLRSKCTKFSLKCWKSGIDLLHAINARTWGGNIHLLGCYFWIYCARIAEQANGICSYFHCVSHSICHETCFKHNWAIIKAFNIWKN